LLPHAAHADGVDVFFSPAYACPLRLRLPRVTAIHDLSFFFWPADFRPMDALRRRLLTAASVRLSEAIVVCSTFTRQEIIRRFPSAESRVHLVRLGPDEDLSPAPNRSAARRHLKVAGPYVISVGSLFNRRRVRELLVAAARLVRRRPDLRLDIVGENRTHPTLDLDAAIRDTGLRSNVNLTGFVSEEALATRYAAADLVVALSEYEGFGLPALEAMARGVPVVVADRPALSEVVGDAGLRVDPADPSDVQAAMERVLESAELAAELRRLGLARAGEFSWERAAAQTWHVIQGALA
jgi:glycosyltransferase involved in cell wall biosynthesis